MSLELSEDQRRAVQEGEPVSVRLSESDDRLVLMQQSRFVELVATLVEDHLKNRTPSDRLHDEIVEEIVSRAWKRAGRRAIVRRLGQESPGNQ